MKAFVLILVGLMGPGALALIGCWEPAAPEKLIRPGSLVIRGTVQTIHWDSEEDQTRPKTDEAPDRDFDPNLKIPREAYFVRATVTIRVEEILLGEAGDLFRGVYTRPMVGLGQCPFAEVEAGTEVIAIFSKVDGQWLAEDSLVPACNWEDANWLARLRQLVKDMQ